MNNDHNPSDTPNGGSGHSHMWLIGILGIAAGLALMIYVPSLDAVSGIILLVAGFHLVGGVVLATSLYATFKRRKQPSRGGNKASGEFDFGWGPAWMLGPWIASLVAASISVALQVAAPDWWPLSLALMLLAANFLVGARFIRSSARGDDAVLPMVDLLSGPEDLVLDAGTGAGRTAIAIGRIVRNGRIVALDRFDSNYIAGGGRALLERNVALAGLADRVEVKHGDLTALPFDDGTFDSAVSAHVIDHLGRNKQRGLEEILRVLKPGGRFLLVVWVPGWTMFAVANLFSFFLTRPQRWRDMASEAGYELLDEGTFNGVWFLLLGRPGQVTTRRPIQGPGALRILAIPAVSEARSHAILL